MPHDQAWHSQGLADGCYIVWQIWWYYFVCHTKVEFVWQTIKELLICHTIRPGTARAWPAATV